MFHSQGKNARQEILTYFRVMGLPGGRKRRAEIAPVQVDTSSFLPGSAVASSKGEVKTEVENPTESFPFLATSSRLRPEGGRESYPG